MHLIGGGGHSKVIVELLNAAGVEIEGVYDEFTNSEYIMGLPIIKEASIENFLKSQKLIISIGNNEVRKKIALKIDLNKFISIMHPNVSFSPSAILGRGSVIMSHVSVNANASIGNHVILNTNASVDHDCIIEDYVHISPNAALAGNVTVGEGTHVGLSASVIQNIKIGKWVTIGAGAVIINDIPDYAVVVGNPGKIIKFNKVNE